MNPHFGDHDPYHMAASAIDEAIRNCVAVGADPARIAILDNFCWGYTDRPETLGSLVRAALACYDMAVALGTPFISGKDSLNNEFRFEQDGQSQRIAIPPSLLISAMGQIDDVRCCVTMDLKTPGSSLYLVGATSDELGGSHFSLVTGATGGQVPRVDSTAAKTAFTAIHRAICQGLVRACHDLSEGGLAVALAEMAFAGGLGARVNLSSISLPHVDHQRAMLVSLFSESNTRFVCEVASRDCVGFESALQDVPFAKLGAVTDVERLVIVHGSSAPSDPERVPIDIETAKLKEAWQAPLRW
jgi:phosphoribosylformylglycinamidine synthase